MRAMLETATVTIGVGAPTRDEVVAVARHGARVELAPEALEAIAGSRAIVEALAADADPHYGVSTGFGALATLHIPPERRTQLQRSLIRSHAAGSGPEVEREVTRALMLLRLSTLATGRTGRADRDGAGLRGDAERRASRRSSTSTARSAAPATSRRSRTARWR